MFDLINPIYLLGLLAATVPLVLHLWGKRKAPKVEFAALHFLFKTDKKIKRHFRVRDGLLLLVRMLACVAATLVLAQPITECQNNANLFDQEFENVIFVVDNSIVGDYHFEETIVLDKARSLIKKQIQRFSPETKIGMVFCDSKESPAIELTLERDTLLREIKNLKPSHRKRMCQEAIPEALSMGDESSTSNTGLILAYPLLANELEQLTSLMSGQKANVRQMEAMQIDMPNVGIQSIVVESDIITPDQYNVTVSLLNKEENDIAGLPLTLKVNGEVLAETLVDLPVDEITPKVMSLATPKAPKPWVVTASIDNPTFTIDNERHVLLEDHKRPFVVLVNGDPKRNRQRNETFFLETTLLKNDHPFASTSPEEINTEVMAKADVVVLANVHTLTPEALAVLKEGQAKGVGLLASGGDQFDEIAYRDYMATLFPVPPVGIHDVKHGGMRENADGLHIQSWQADHPIFRKFLFQAKEIASAQFYKHVLFPPSKEAYSTLASFDNGSPAIVEFSKKNARSIYFTSTLDRDWNDFSIHQGFVPWFLETLKYLSFKETDADNEVVVGQTFRTDRLKNFGNLEVLTPNGQRIQVPAHGKDGIIEFESMTSTGLYTFTSDDAKQAKKTHVVIANADPTLLDLHTAPLPPEQKTSSGRRASTTKHRLWRFLSPFFLVLLLFEAYASWRRTQKTLI